MEDGNGELRIYKKRGEDAKKNRSDIVNRQMSPCRENVTGGLLKGAYYLQPSDLHTSKVACHRFLTYPEKSWLITVTVPKIQQVLQVVGTAFFDK